MMLTAGFGLRVIHAECKQCSVCGVEYMESDMGTAAMAIQISNKAIEAARKTDRLLERVATAEGHRDSSRPVLLTYLRKDGEIETKSFLTWNEAEAFRKQNKIEVLDCLATDQPEENVCLMG